jgi:uncharacterized protein DUF1801
MPRSTVAEYLAALPDDRRPAIAAVRGLIRKNLPKGYVEALSGSTITYAVPLSRLPDTYNGQPLWYAALAAQKNHNALYLMCAYGSSEQAGFLKREFAKAGKKLDMGKSCLRFRSLEDLVLPAIGKVIASQPVDAYIAHYRASRSTRKP